MLILYLRAASDKGFFVLDTGTSDGIWCDRDGEVLYSSVKWLESEWKDEIECGRFSRWEDLYFWVNSYD